MSVTTTCADIPQCDFTYTEVDFNKILDIVMLAART